MKALRGCIFYREYVFPTLSFLSGGCRLKCDAHALSTDGVLHPLKVLGIAFLNKLEQVLQDVRCLR